MQNKDGVLYIHRMYGVLVEWQRTHNRAAAEMQTSSEEHLVIQAFWSYSDEQCCVIEEADEESVG